MPIYSHLEQTRIIYSDIPAKVKAAAALGAPYSPDELENAVELAREQARRIVQQIVEQNGPSRVPAPGYDSGYLDLENARVIALIAYMQRLGIDLYATDTPPAPPAGETITPDDSAGRETDPSDVGGRP